MLPYEKKMGGKKFGTNSHKKKFGGKKIFSLKKLLSDSESD